MQSSIGRSAPFSISSWVLVCTRSLGRPGEILLFTLHSRKHINGRNERLVEVNSTRSCIFLPMLHYGIVSSFFPSYILLLIPDHTRHRPSPPRLGRVNRTLSSRAFPSANSLVERYSSEETRSRPSGFFLFFRRAGPGSSSRVIIRYRLLSRVVLPPWGFLEEWHCREIEARLLRPSDKLTSFFFPSHVVPPSCLQYLDRRPPNDEEQPRLFGNITNLLGTGTAFSPLLFHFPPPDDRFPFLAVRLPSLVSLGLRDQVGTFPAPTTIRKSPLH